MIIIDGKNSILGRLAAYVAKEALKGEEVVIVNCSEVIVTGNKKTIQREFQEKRTRVGSGLKGPKIHRSSEKIVKRAIRGMLPHHQSGRGKQAFKRIKCYNGVPKEFEDLEKISIKSPKKKKFIKVKEIFK